jgi:DNA-binding beta-propeller fold protein YncE
MPARLFFTFCALLIAPVQAASIDIVAGPGQISLNEPFAVAFDRDGNWYILEHKGQRIIRAGKDGKFTPFAGTGQTGRSGDGGPALEARFFDPHGLVASRDGRTLYVADTLNNQVRIIDLRSGAITALAGTGEKGFSGDNGPGVQAAFNGVFSIALGHDGQSLFLADLGNRRIRRIDLRSGIVTTVAGNGNRGIPADGSPAAASPLEDPRAVAVDSKGQLYIVERNGNALRVVDRSGSIRTLVAPGQLKLDLKGPKHLCIDSNDNVIIADAENHLIRRYNPRDGSTVTILGTGNPGAHVYPSDPLKTETNRPHGVVFNRSGDLYVSDSDNHRILRVQAVAP